MYIVFYGPEGAGKGTQAKLLAEKFGLPVLTSGDLVREAAINDSGLLGEVCRKSLTEGKYVADSEMFVLWKNKLKQKTMRKGWIMDGFPRNLNQARFLDRKVTKYGYKIDRVFYLKIKPEESMRRLLKRGRRLHPENSELHDSPERIKQRLKMYRQGEKEVLEFYGKKGVFEEVNGERSIEEVHQDIMSRLKK